jgi:RND family efflux transporter MFP subunit
MSEQEFELYLKLLSRCLGLTPSQREQIADELRDHLEERLEELARAGVPREKAVVQALDEFGDAAVLAGDFATIARLKRRRFLMRLSLGSVGVLTAALLVAYAFWPENRAVRGPERVVAQEKPARPDAAQKTSEPKASPPVIEVCRPVSKEVTDYQIFPGNVQPSQSVQIRTQATGYLQKINFRRGQLVKRGDPLFEIDPSIDQAEAEKADAELDRTKARLVYAQAQFQRVQHIFKTQAVQPEELDKAASERRVAEADVELALANRQLAKLRLSYAHVVAPISGYISRSSLDVGSFVKAEANALATIVVLDPVCVSIDVDEVTWFGLRKQIQRGKFHDSEIPVEVSVPRAGDLNRKGFLEFVDDAAFNVGSTSMRVRVPNSDTALVAGLGVHVRLAGNAHRALLVPEKALDEGKQEPIVWVVNDQNVLQERGIRFTGSLHEGGLREIAYGLKGDEWVVCNASHDAPLRAGKRIEPKRVP